MIKLVRKRSIKVGDVVTHFSSGLERYKVLCIDGNQAWVQKQSNCDRLTVLTESLTLAP
jgi:hypothetical protein